MEVMLGMSDVKGCRHMHQADSQCRFRDCFGARRPRRLHSAHSRSDQDVRCFSKLHETQDEPQKHHSGSIHHSLQQKKRGKSALIAFSNVMGPGFQHSLASESSRVALPFASVLALGSILPGNCLAANNGLFAIADIDPKTAGLIATILSPILTLSILLFIFRIPMSWYPNLNFKKFPWALIVVPTEPVLGPTRKAVPPVGGVDIAPIIWVAVLSFFNEILLGPQGILNLLQRQLQL